MVQLIELPFEILSSLPLYIRDIEDFTEAASTCRTLSFAFSVASPNCILRLAANSAPTFAQPHPYFLIAATARQLSDWALGNAENTKRLRLAFQDGVEGLLELCIEKAGLSLHDIRRLHLARFSIINPLADKIDKLAGDQWYQAEDFWDGGVSEPATLETDSNRAAYQIIIYGELFASTMQAYLEPERNLPKFNLDVRLDYIKYCIPDWVCRSYPGLEVLSVGPYVGRRGPGQGDLPADQIALQHILKCGRWTRVWQSVTQAIGPDFDGWKQKLWFDAVQIQGLEGMKVLETGGVEEQHKLLLRLRNLVEKLGPGDEPSKHLIGTRRKIPVSDAPDFSNEVYVCMASYWGG
ncbi:hypothetical protein J3R30DRAFT_3279862 [Lentinula aciculospora]|uniref:Uncharacterized protein n=1 Tax=Lentinula aciculospora TaxID=153920 RepID=A0A9W9DWN1_9AGAR|nr:hypothetical protein J3R30DRAFT_3657651 [Lentinula aciculospora]KAJ4487627.1 hypothetical protein J3R30DRAFT_3279862 [Lentinula aciculospora]